MKRAFTLVCLFSLLFIPNIRAQFEGTVGIGLHAGYGAEINSVGGGAHIHYYYTNQVRFAPSFTYFIERKDSHMWMAEADAHYILPVSISASLYPIGGLLYSRWAQDGTLEGESRLPAQIDHRLGLNMGLGLQHDIGYRVRANYELKYQFIRDHSQMVFMAGFGFWF